ncbi:serine protease [Streptomyces sp. JJ36]|uniref:trypsin-like serine peptidase n=1 Tax=Streptomyces sp. JJ36 TaxID=2736645 RepID=UPI001F36BCBD|nr:peptidase [Streptomyces sp. JJ36]MCF6526100.1 peptidase [Streptomyces sp. JJ36]
MRRSRTTRTALGALLSVGALVATALQAGAATAAPPPSPAPAATHPAAQSAAEQQRTRDFWTPERMRSATPLDLLEAERGEVSGAVPRGEKQTVAPTAAPSETATPMAFPQGGGPWTGGGDVVATAGRVFFTYQGRTASCSGNAVTSANKSTVMTAGHCVKLEGSWHTDWVFVPGYHDGQAPYGEWTAAETLATPQWSASEDMNYDVGAAVVNPLGGQLLTDVVGGQGLAFNTGYNRDMYAFGFPAADPYDGEKFIYCSGTTIRDFLLSDDHGMNCDMTGGSSGGPWFTQFDEGSGTGLQSSVNSFKYTFLPNYMFGPYFGADAQNLYNEAQSS